MKSLVAAYNWAFIDHSHYAAITTLLGTLGACLSKQTSWYTLIPVVLALGVQFKGAEAK